MKALCIFAGIALLYVACADVCKDHSKWCKYKTRYGACNFSKDTQKDCPRSCGFCKVDCSNKDVTSRKDCGQFGTTREDCLMKGCCWDPLKKESSQPWCFYPAKHK